MDTSSKIKEDWKTKGFDPYGKRPLESQPKTADYIGGANFDVLLDELLFNRMIKLKDLRKAPQGNEPGKIYWDGENKKYKLYLGEQGGWADVNYTSTSTSSTSSSSSSTSTSTSSTSSSSSTSSTSSSSTSTS